MSLIEWRPEFELGLAPLDFEHKDLLERVNELHTRCSTTTEPAVVAECLGLLHSRLSAHFALEEKTMREMRNPHFAEHKAEHDRFLDEVTGVVAAFDDESAVEWAHLESFAGRVRDWIVGHITTVDRQLVERGSAT